MLLYQAQILPPGPRQRPRGGRGGQIPGPVTWSVALCAPRSAETLPGGPARHPCGSKSLGRERLQGRAPKSASPFVQRGRSGPPGLCFRPRTSATPPAGCWARSAVPSGPRGDARLRGAAGLRAARRRPSLSTAAVVTAVLSNSHHVWGPRFPGGVLRVAQPPEPRWMPSLREEGFTTKGRAVDQVRAPPLPTGRLRLGCGTHVTGTGQP